MRASHRNQFQLSQWNQTKRHAHRSIHVRLRNLSRSSLLYFPPFLGDILFSLYRHYCQSLCTSDEVWTQWVMAMCISLAAKWRKLKQIVLSVCRSLFNDSELWISPFFLIHSHSFSSYLPSPLLFFLFLCLSQDNCITQRLLLHLRRLNGVSRCVLFLFCYHSYAWLHCLFHLFCV